MFLMEHSVMNVMNIYEPFVWEIFRCNNATLLTSYPATVSGCQGLNTLPVSSSG